MKKKSKKIQLKSRNVKIFINNNFFGKELNH